MGQRSLLRSLVTLAVACVVFAALDAPAAGLGTDNIWLIDNFKFPGGGNELAFDDDLIYVGQYRSPGDAIQVLRMRGKNVTKVASIPCGGHNDMAVLDDGFMAVSFQGAGRKCNEPALADPGAGGGIEPGGVQILDVSNPQRPRYHANIVIDGGTHTVTRLPGHDYVYAALGGAEKYAIYAGNTHIIDVSNPKQPKIAGTYTSPLNPAGCHDIAFDRIGGKLIGFCPGLGGTEIWDMSDPVAPAPIARVLLPFGQLPHNVAVSSDDKLLAIGDEAYVGHACNPASPAGAIWFYDITDLANPVMVGRVGPPRGMLPVGALSGNTISCTAHSFNFIPNTKLLVASWISGGVNVLDLSDPAAPKEVAWFLPEDAVTMSAYWYRGLIFTADFIRGADVLGFDRS